MEEGVATARSQDTYARAHTPLRVTALPTAAAGVLWQRRESACAYVAWPRAVSCSVCPGDGC